MISKEVLKYIARIELQTRRLLKNSSMAGNNRATTKGTGFEFGQIRDYQQGDDIRFIDWRGSARVQKLMTKEYIEERNRTIILAVDISASSFFSSGTASKFWYNAQITGFLALVGQYAKDKVGLILFTDSIELYIPPRSGKEHVFALLARFFSYKAVSSGTSFSCLANHLLSIGHKNAMVYVVSDFIAPLEAVKWTSLKRMYDMIIIRTNDHIERALPEIGFLTVNDIESGISLNLDLRNRGVLQINDYLHYRMKQQEQLLKRAGIVLIDVGSHENFMVDLVRCIRARMIR